MYHVRLGFCQEILRTNKNTAGTRMDSCPVLVRSTETEETELWDFLHPRPKIGARRCYWSVACNMIELLVSHPTCYSFFQETLNCSYDFFIQHLVPTSIIDFHQLWFVPWLSAAFCRQGQPGIRLGTPWGNWTTKKAWYFSSHQMDQWGIRGVSTSCFNQPGNAKLPDLSHSVITVQNVWTKIATPGGDAFVVETAEEMMEIWLKRGGKL